jgi:hypothetical protein
LIVWSVGFCFVVWLIFWLLFYVLLVGCLFVGWFVGLLVVVFGYWLAGCQAEFIPPKIAFSNIAKRFHILLKIW